MTQTQILQRDLEVAIDDAQLLACRQISGAIEYLHQAQRFDATEIRALVDEIICSHVPMRPFLVS